MSAGFLDRVKGIFRVHADRTVSRFETPDVLAEQAVLSAKGNRDQVYAQLVKSKAAEVEARQRSRQALQEAQVYRERARSRLQRGDRGGAELAMNEALQREEMAERLSADCEQAGQVNAELSLSLARMDSEIADVKMRSVISTSRYRQAEAIKGVAVARYGDPDHPRRGAQEMLETAEERTARLASTGQAVWEIGQALPNAEFSPDDRASQVALEIESMERGMTGALEAGATATTDPEAPAPSAHAETSGEEMETS